MSEEERMSDQPDLPSDLSDDNQMYSAEFKDGQLHIVEVSPYDKGGDNQGENEISYEPDTVLPEAADADDGEQTKYLQLDLLNFTIVKNADGTNTYQMVSSDSATAENGDTTITCVLSSDDVEEGDNRESYVMIQADSEEDPYMYLSTQNSAEQNEITTTDSNQTETLPAPSQSTKKSIALTPVQILEKAKALQKAKAFLTSAAVSKSKRGRKRKSDLPPPMELLSSPNFKLYLYSCKQCTFKCNAVKEMSAHKKTEHSNVKGGGVTRAALQCARCPYRAHTHSQLINHSSRTHSKDLSTGDNEFITALQLDSEEVEAADVLVCGACGFESGDRALFKKHIEDAHGAITSVR